MEAHNGISAKIVERTGFQAIWGSGLTLSGSNAVRDSNELSWTQLVDTLERMSDVVNIPILFDGDTGFGNYNNARRLVRKLEERRIAGVCFEDKLFPKTNSFIDSEAQTLANVTEHANKITACKEFQRDPNFSVVARLESLIVGAGIDDALMRAEKYTKAGADAILVHSKKSTFKEISDFCVQFKKINEQCNTIPLVVVPTKYYTTPIKEMTDVGVTNFIWANHNLRASIDAMEHVSKQIFDEQSLINVEHQVSTVNEIFDYQEDSKLRKDDKYYMGEKLITYTNPKDNFEQIFGGELTTEKTKVKQVCSKMLREIFKKVDITYHVGVPDSTLKEYFDNKTDVVVANEGIAMSMAAGYALETSNLPLVYLQNSGFGNLLNPLLSLNAVYKFPSVMLMGWRGHDQKDEVQHNAQGRITPKLLRLYNIPYTVINGDETEEALTKMITSLKALAVKDQTTTCILVRTERFLPIKSVKPESVGHIDPDLVMETIVCNIKNSKIITSTGFNTRRFYDNMVKFPNFNLNNNKTFFCPGSMGHALSIGIGASTKSDARIVVVDGDGGFHMHSGTANNVNDARNLTHIILDNSAHESVGQQKTCGTSSTNLLTILNAYPYDSVTQVTDCDELKKKIEETVTGRHAIICPTRLSDTKFGRPSMKPNDIKRYVAEWRKKSCEEITLGENKNS
jgi:phosphoenolpyruvate phosphomutase